MSERIKYYLDEHVNPAVADGLRRRGIDAITTVEAKMLGAEDIEHLELATSMGRVVFTQDRDFLRLSARGASHAGVVYFADQRDIGRIVVGLHRIYERSTSEYMRNRVAYI